MTTALTDAEQRRLFHNKQMEEARQNIRLRLELGTKSGTPKQLDKKRLKPLYYSNPLPDNSSGSKIRPFQCSKDESGRPTPMEMVLANQKRGNGMRSMRSMRGGVLTDFRVARRLLDRRAEDVRNMELEAQGLPPRESAPVILTTEDSLALEFNNLLSTLQQNISGGIFDRITLQELKNIPRLLLNVLPSFTPTDVVELIQYIDDDFITELREDNLAETVTSSRILLFFENMRKFLKDILPFMASDLGTKSNAIRRLGLQAFGKQGALFQRLPGSQARRVRRVRDAEPGEDEEYARLFPEMAEEEEEEDDEPPPPPVRRRPIVAPPRRGVEPPMRARRG